VGFARRFHPNITVGSPLEKEASLLMVCAFVESIFALLVVKPWAMKKMYTTVSYISLEAMSQRRI